MAGQDATLTLEQAKKQQERIMANSENHQGPKNPSSHHELCEKTPHQGK